MFLSPNSEEEGAAMSNQGLKCADLLHAIYIETKMLQNYLLFLNNSINGRLVDTHMIYYMHIFGSTSNEE